MSQFQPPPHWQAPQYPPPPETYYPPQQPMMPVPPPKKRMRRNDKIALSIIGSLVAVAAIVVLGMAANAAGTASLADQQATSTANAVNVAATNSAFENTAIAVSSSWMTNVPTDTPIAQPTPTPAHVPVWTTTHTFTGNGDKSTEIFSVPDDWKVLYTCTYQDGGQVDGALGVEVYGADNSIIDVAINATCHNARSTGETEEHQAGQVFLKMISTGDWTVQVQELQ